MKEINSGLIEKILAKQKPGGYWADETNFYVYTKYKGTVWTVILLAELGADGSDPRIREACEFLLKRSQHRSSGGFSCRGNAKSGGDEREVIPCLTGNMVYCMVKFGMFSDSRLQKAVDWITTYQRFDDGECPAPKGFPYRSEQCWGKHTCMTGVANALRGLAEIPAAQRSSQVKKTIQQAVEFILIHRLYRRSHDLSQVANPYWLKLGWPHMWNTDILGMLSTLQKLGIRDERMVPALEKLVELRGRDGFWINEDAKEGRMQVRVEKEGEPSPRLTQMAVSVLNFSSEFFHGSKK